MEKTLIAISLLAWLAMAPAAADGGEACYRADADSGMLAFVGEADGNEFRGRFEAFGVDVCMSGHDLATGGIEVIVETDSADTRNRERDAELHGEQFFHVEAHPEAVWTSSVIEPAEGGGYRARGELTLKGVSADQPVDLQLDETDDGLRLSGSARIMRLDWDVGTGEFTDTDFLRNRVDLEFDLGLEAAVD